LQLATSALYFKEISFSKSCTVAKPIAIRKTEKANATNQTNARKRKRKQNKFTSKQEKEKVKMNEIDSHRLSVWRTTGFLLETGTCLVRGRLQVLVVMVLGVGLVCQETNRLQRIS
jgi:hypothetical protein